MLRTQELSLCRYVNKGSCNLANLENHSRGQKPEALPAPVGSGGCNLGSPSGQLTWEPGPLLPPGGHFLPCSFAPAPEASSGALSPGVMLRTSLRAGPQSHHYISVLVVLEPGAGTEDLWRAFACPLGLDFYVVRLWVLVPSLCPQTSPYAVGSWQGTRGHTSSQLGLRVRRFELQAWLQPIKLCGPELALPLVPN